MFIKIYRAARRQDSVFLRRAVGRARNSGRALSQCGLTLVEMVVFIVIVGVALAGVLATYQIAVRGSADPLVSRQLQAIAEAMLEEVLLQDFADPDGSGVEANRALYDDVDDYKNYGVGVAGIFYPNGDPVPNLGGYGVEVSVASAADWNGALAKRITVRATHGANQSFTLSGYRTQDPAP